MLERIGYADAVIARETDDGLVLIDGHLRAGLDAEQDVPALIVDLNDAEAGEVLATLDPIAAMAETDKDALNALLDGIRDELPMEVLLPAGAPDALQEWTPDLPEFDKPENFHHRLTVHLPRDDDAAIEEFSKLLGVPITRKTKFVYWPAETKPVKHSVIGKEWVADK